MYQKKAKCMYRLSLEEESQKVSDTLKLVSDKLLAKTLCEGAWDSRCHQVIMGVI